MAIKAWLYLLYDIPSLCNVLYLNWIWALSISLLSTSPLTLRIFRPPLSLVLLRRLPAPMPATSTQDSRWLTMPLLIAVHTSTSSEYLTQFKKSHIRSFWVHESLPCLLARKRKRVNPYSAFIFFLESISLWLQSGALWGYPTRCTYYFSRNASVSSLALVWIVKTGK